MSLHLLRRAEAHGSRLALMSPGGAVTYRELLQRSEAVASQLLGLEGRGAAGGAAPDRQGLRARPQADPREESQTEPRADLTEGPRADPQGDLREKPVAYLMSPGWEYVAVQWGIWRAGGIAVPLSPLHPPAELAHVLEDAAPLTVVADSALMDRVREASAGGNLRLQSTEEFLGRDGSGRGRRPSPGHGPDIPVDPPVAGLPDVDPSRAALMLYTSGTTGRPKGVVITHANIRAQVTSMAEAWGWRPSDRILTHLPLHHVHGIVNAITTALWTGACCEIQPRFDPTAVWERLAEGDITLYMAVPTVYRRLIAAWEAQDASTRDRWAAGARRCRLMVSGSAALPVPTLERWETITGQRLLERYGMTEIGMALSNPLDGERRPGFVGTPMPGVEARLVDESDAPVPVGSSGEIHVRGPNVFREYWGRPEETVAAFASGGWFRTGDHAVVEDGAWRILGRSSVDILKTGGEKISALEIEDVLRLHPAVADCAVVGVDDPEWGQRVCAAVVPREGVDSVTAASLKGFVKKRLAPYKVPKEYRVVDALPTNAMGKVNKPRVRNLFGDST
ncbi:MAG: acyl-CoA synthetase [Gemmatimonadales bacterium]|nr:MAG: acyl-CoA synthetase [Gemmatimonadales bacterium]